MSPTPRGFLEIPGLEHLGLVFERKIFTEPDEFNVANAAISDSRFPNRGCQFFAYALTADDEAKIPPAEPSDLTEKPSDPETEPSELPPVVPPAPPVEPPVIHKGDDQIPVNFKDFADSPPAAPQAKSLDLLREDSFTLSGRDILLDGQKVAALSANDALRVLPAKKHLRHAIEAWLASQP